MDTSYNADFNIRQFWQLLSFSKYLLLFDIAELSLLHRADTRGTERPFMALTHPPTHNNNLILRPLRNETCFWLIVWLRSASPLFDHCRENCRSISGANIFSCCGYLSTGQRGSVRGPAAAAGGLHKRVLLNHAKRRPARELERERERLEGNDWLWVWPAQLCTADHVRLVLIIHPSRRRPTPSHGLKVCPVSVPFCSMRLTTSSQLVLLVRPLQLCFCTV